MHCPTRWAFNAKWFGILVRQFRCGICAIAIVTTTQVLAQCEDDRQLCGRLANDTRRRSHSTSFCAICDVVVVAVIGLVIAQQVEQHFIFVFAYAVEVGHDERLRLIGDTVNELARIYFIERQVGIGRFNELFAWL